MRDISKRLKNIANKLVNINKAQRVIIVELKDQDEKRSRLMEFYTKRQKIRKRYRLRNYNRRIYKTNATIRPQL